MGVGTPASALPRSSSNEKTKKKTLQTDQVEDVKDTEVKKAPDGQAQSGPILVFADIETGWNEEQVERILKHYGKGKVAISIEGSRTMDGVLSGRGPRRERLVLAVDWRPPPELDQDDEGASPSRRHKAGSPASGRRYHGRR